MSKVFNSVAEVMGTFFEEVTQIGESSEPSHRRSKRRGPSPHQGKGHKSDESDQPTEDSDYVLDESDEEYNEETSDSVHSSENEDKDAAVADGESEGEKVKTNPQQMMTRRRPQQMMTLRRSQQMMTRRRGVKMTNKTSLIVRHQWNTMELIFSQSL